MVLFIKRGKSRHAAIPRVFRRNRRSLADDLRVRADSPGFSNSGKHVVIVMDGLKDFTTELLEWALKNIMGPGYVVSLLGVMPWLNIPLSSKTWQDVWMVDFDYLSLIKEKNEWKNEAKYLKLQAVMDLCKKHGVVPQKEVVMGHPLPWLVLERIISLGATWVVIDRDLKKNREFFAERIPCNVVMKNGEGDMDMIKGRSLIDNEESSPSESPASLVPTPQVVISEQLRQILGEQGSEETRQIAWKSCVFRSNRSEYGAGITPSKL